MVADTMKIVRFSALQLTKVTIFDLLSIPLLLEF